MHGALSQLVVAIEKKKCYATPYFTQSLEVINRLRSGVSEHPECCSSASPGFLSRCRLPRSAKHPAVVFAVFIKLRVSRTDC